MIHKDYIAIAHTPGPWKAAGEWVTDGIAAVCTCNVPNRSPQTAEANAIFIASAPDLYNALLELVGATFAIEPGDKIDVRVLHLATEAIAKAGGKP